MGRLKVQLHGEKSTNKGYLGRLLRCSVAGWVLLCGGGDMCVTAYICMSVSCGVLWYHQVALGAAVQMVVLLLLC